MRFPELEKIFRLACAAALLYFLIRILTYHFHVVIFPFANTYREAVSMMSTDALVKGLNPFAMNLQPGHANTYGIVYPLLVWPFAKLFGTTLLVHRVVTGIFIAASCGFCFFVMRWMGIDPLLNACAVLILYASWVFPATSTPCVDPASVGLFLMLVTVFVPFLCTYSTGSCFVSIVCGLCAFYTKPYFFLGVPIIGSYLFFFISKRKGLFYTAVSLGAFIVSVLWMNSFFPAYFNSCFLVILNTVTSTVERLYFQLSWYGQLHLGVLIVIGYALGLAILKLVKGYPDKFRLRLSIRDLTQPLISPACPLVVYALMCVSVVLYCWMGRNGGALLWYFFQLLSPFLLIGVVGMVTHSSLGRRICFLLLLFNLYVLTRPLDYHFFDNRAGWLEISGLVQGHQHILNTPLVAPLLVEQNKEVFDDGATMDYVYGARHDASFLRAVFKNDPDILPRFLKSIDEKAKRHAYDLLLIRLDDPLGVPESISNSYRMLGRIWVYVPQDRVPYEITVWVPKMGNLIF